MQVPQRALSPPQRALSPPQRAPSPPQCVLSPPQLAPSTPQGSVPNPQNNGKLLSASHKDCGSAPSSKFNPTAVPQHDPNTSSVPPRAQINDELTSTIHSGCPPRRSPQPDDEQVLGLSVLGKTANISRAGDSADEADLL